MSKPGDEIQKVIDDIDKAGKFVCERCGATVHLKDGCLHIDKTPDGVEKYCEACK